MSIPIRGSELFVDKFYITTPLYYVNAKLHVGHTYTTVFSDALARYYKACGKKVFFLTGSDEHGQKIFDAAQKQGKTPKALADENVSYFVELWKRMEIGYDKFIRTTDTDHEERVKKILGILWEKGDIYKGRYEAFQCVPCESFWNEGELKDGKCPQCGGPVKHVSEENYFFRMSKYKDIIKEKLIKNPLLIKPEIRYNEIMGKIDGAMDDKSISRSDFDWGIPLPFDEKQVTYVWFDAILNYITALGYPDDMDMFNRFWPADAHVIAKDILWFHTLFWYSILEALGVELPAVYAHGYWLFKGGKMSKRTGSVIDPFELSDKYGVEPLKYFLLSELPEGADTDYSEDRLVEKFNNDLVNTFSNSLHRTMTMFEKYLGGKFAAVAPGEHEEKLKNSFAQASAAYRKHFREFRINMALKDIMDFVRAINGYIQDTEPFKSADNDKARTSTIIYHVLESLRNAAVMLYPVMPGTAGIVLKNLNRPPEGIEFEQELKWGLLDTAAAYKKNEPIFMRLK